MRTQVVETVMYNAAAILDDLGVLTLDHGKQLFVDGSGGSGGVRLS